MGYEPLILSTLITGDAAVSGELYAAIIREALESGNPLAPPCAIVSGGEATVTVGETGLVVQTWSSRSRSPSSWMG